jgi:hypothetical protein
MWIGHQSATPVFRPHICKVDDYFFIIFVNAFFPRREYLPLNAVVRNGLTLMRKKMTNDIYNILLNSARFVPIL